MYFEASGNVAETINLYHSNEVTLQAGAGAQVWPGLRWLPSQHKQARVQQGCLWHCHRREGGDGAGLLQK